MTPSQEDEARRELARLARWLSGAGIALIVAALPLVCVLLSEWPGWRNPASAGFGLPLVPGVLYLVLGAHLARGQRWALVGAEILSWLIWYTVGTVVLFSLYALPGSWPILAISGGWLWVLGYILMRLGGASKAMGILRQRPRVYGFDPVGVREAGSEPIAGK